MASINHSHPLYDSKDWSTNDDDDDDEDTAYPQRGQQSKEDTKRNQIILIALATALIAIGIWLGRVSRGHPDLEMEERIRWSGSKFNQVDTPSLNASECDPYAQTGILLVDEDTWRENRWFSFDTSDSCKPMNYMDLIHEGSMHKSLDFLRGKTIALLGDSVDREHTEHLCMFAQGVLEPILEDHWLSPDLPRGRQDRPGKPKGIGWEDNGSGRPYLCTIEKYDLKILNFFFYGLSDEDGWLVQDSGHFYPPGRLENRFHDHMIPILTKLNPKNPIPDLFSFTPGFWDMHRMAQYDPDRWSEIKKAKLEWWRESMREALQGMIDYWPGDRPRILWRSLHHIQSWDMIPFNRLQIVDSIGRSVVSSFINEDDLRLATLPPPHKLHSPHASRPPHRDSPHIPQISPPPHSSRPPHRDSPHVPHIPPPEARAVPSEDVFSRRDRVYGAYPHENVPSSQVMRWNHDVQRAPSTEQGESGNNARVRLGDRLKIDNWGRLMLGQEKHFRDNLHPLPIPGSWLYGDMLLHELKRADVYQQRRKSDS